VNDEPIRGRVRPVPKGRQVQPRAATEIAALLGERPRRRDLLVEHLHLIQDAYGQLSAPHLVALAEEMGLAFAEVYETATFYAHFDVVKEGDAPLPARTVRVCDSLTCALFGADALLATLQHEAPAGVRVVRAPCVGRCDVAPVAAVGPRYVDRATPAAVASELASGRTEPELPPAVDYDAYVAGGGYRLLAQLRSGALAVDAVLDALDAAGLRGLGGAGFPTGRKWRAVRGEAGPRLMCVNADEGEPGTFKDRWILERDPHRFLEGMLIAAQVVEADEIYLYLRDEYAAARLLLVRELARLPAGGPAIHLRRGAGAYVCGEESSLLESVEGKRGYPRQRPPLPFQVGLFGRPTLINNVETLFWVRDVVERGPAWWSGHGRHGRTGLRSFSVSGRVNDPGVKLAPAGITVRELIDEHCGGIAAGEVFAAYLPGGASGGILPAAKDDLPLDFGTLEPHGALIGSAAVIVLGARDDLREATRNLMRFFADESCGQCTPCRVGTEKAVRLLEEPRWDVDLLGELAGVMRDASICGLGQAAANPLTSLLAHFPAVVAEDGR
jgi:formate dehydrogenase